MSDYQPRLNADGIFNNPYWYVRNPFYQSGYGLPNCTCYCYGRWWEIADPDRRFLNEPNLCLYDANDWWTYNDGYQRGQTPQLGAVLCLYGGNYSGRGHVAIVEQINPDGSILTSESALNGYYWELRRRVPPNYEFDPDDGYIFKGFIYNPYAGQIAPPVEPQNWITGNRYLTQSEKDQNAIKFYYTMARLGFSYNAILGMLANVDQESTINPGIWESLDPFVGGYGLVQWTPYTKYSDWAGSGWEDNGDKECERIDYEAQNGLQWFDNPAAPQIGYPDIPPVTFAEFKTSEQSAAVLADYWLLYYEHPNAAHLVDRQIANRQLVDYYNNLIGGYIPPAPIPLGKKILYMAMKKMKGKKNGDSAATRIHRIV